jgi:hypothetical protein
MMLSVSFWTNSILHCDSQGSRSSAAVNAVAITNEVTISAGSIRTKSEIVALRDAGPETGPRFRPSWWSTAARRFQRLTMRAPSRPVR